MVRLISAGGVNVTGVLAQSATAQTGTVASVWWEGRSLLDGLGVITRISDVRGRQLRTVLAIEHPCLACAVRHDLLRAIREAAGRGARALDVVLPPGIDPAPVHAVLREQATSERLVPAQLLVALNERTALIDLAGSELLAARGWDVTPGDSTYVAESLLRRIEAAHTLLLDHRPTGELAELLSSVAPDAQLTSTVGPPTTRRDDDPRPGWDHALDRASGALGSGGRATWRGRFYCTVIWRARRPIHPERLLDTLPKIADMTLRIRGSLWLPRRPDDRIALDHAGPGLQLRRDGRWAAAGSPAAYAALPAAERRRAQHVWTHRYGDRRHELVAFGEIDRLDPARLWQLLDGCLLEDRLDLPLSWASTLPDPLAAHLGYHGPEAA